MADNTHEAVWEWLLDCPHIQDLFFNYARVQNGDTVLTPATAYNDTVIRDFIGASERRYDFTLIRFDALSDAPNSTDNINSLFDVEKIAAWIEAQNGARNFPRLPGGCTVTEVAVHPSGVGYFAAQDDDGQAKYLFQFYVEYLKEE